MNRQLALFLTYLCHPLFLVNVGAFFILTLDRAYHYGVSLKPKLFLLGLLFLNTFVIPSLIVVLLQKRGMIKSLMMESREERKLPLMVASACLMLTYYLFSSSRYLNFSYLFNSYLLGVTSSIVAAAVISFYYKISLHAIALGGISGLIAVLQQHAVFDLRPLLAFWIVLSALTASARVFLHSHRPGQVYAGFLCGFLCVNLIMHL